MCHPCEASHASVDPRIYSHQIVIPVSKPRLTKEGIFPAPLMHQHFRRPSLLHEERMDEAIK